MGMRKTGFFLSCFVLLSAFGLADVQWLRYHSSANVEDELSTSGNRPYRQFEKAQPKEVRCPKFKGDKPLFMKWKTTMDKGGFRWVAMDRSAAHGLYNILYIDSNGDGHLDDEKSYQGRIQDNYRTGFDPIAVYFEGEDGPITYHLSCEFYSYEERSTYLAIATGCYYEGTVLIDGKQVPCVLLDYNGNGTFDDTSDSFNADRILLGQERDRKAFHVGRYLEYADALYRVKIARDGAFIEVTAAPDVAYGVVNVPPTLTKFSAGGINGLYEKTPKDGQVRLPEGTYRIYKWEIARKDKGQKWVLSGSGFPQAQTLTIQPESPATVDVGEPIFSQLSVSQREGMYSINQELRGKQGERISLLKNGNQPAAPKVNIRSMTGEYDRTFSLEYG